ncbi:MAG: transketolase, partial [Pseudolabrys sp.]
SRSKDADDVDFATGSVGLGVAQTLFSSLTQDYVRAHGWGLDRPEGRMISLVGDAELDEGNIFEALLEGWKQPLRNCWWIVDYNRQSLDAVVREGLWARYQQLFENFGWDVVIVKYGSLQQAAFKEPGGDELKAWIDNCPNQLYSALVFAGGAAWRKRLNDEIGDQGDVSRLIEKRSDAELAALMNNLGGHDLPAVLDAFHGVKTDKPTCFICYTVKGFGLPMAGHKDNHAGLMTPAQMDTFKEANNVRSGHEWDKFEGLANAKDVEAFLKRVPFAAGGERRLKAPAIPVPEKLPVPQQTSNSTQAGFGAILNDIARGEDDFTQRIVTTSPDVTVSTNLGGWVNRRGLFAHEAMQDTFRNERIPSTFNWTFSPQGQHIELGIAEANLFTLLSALGLSHSINGVRLLPVGTLYDPFVARGLDQLNYACYQDARFMAVGTPSGITLAPEGGAHQSIAEPLIGMAQDGLAAFEPAYVDELAIIMRWAFDYMQKDGDAANDYSLVARPDEKPVPTFSGHAPEQTWLRDETGGSVYLRLSTRPIDQIARQMTPELERDVVDGAYWQRKPGPNAQVIVAYSGVIAPEAIAAVGLIAEDRRDVGLLAVTSADRLNAGWTAAQRARERGLVHARSHIERLLADVPPHCGIVTVLDGHPATLAWLGAVNGHRTRSLGVEHFGQTGSLAELYRHYGIDANAIVAAAQAIAPGRPIRHLKALP